MRHIVFALILGLLSQTTMAHEARKVVGTSARPQTVSIEQLELLEHAKSYYQRQLFLANLSAIILGSTEPLKRKLPPPDYSKPGGYERCQKMICTTLGNSSCKFESDLDQAKQLCSNQYDETCMQNWCTIQVGSPCRSMSNFAEASQVCEEVGGPCLKSICDRLGPNACRQSSELKDVASVCRGFYDSDCVDSVCSNTKGNLCRNLSGLKEASEACKIEQKAISEPTKN